MKPSLIGLAAILGLPLFALGQTGYSIAGGLSNFDVHNRCDEPCNEFEIEIEGIRPEDIVHTYHNGNYGAPTVTLSAGGNSTIIDYRNPQHMTAVNTIEHFGVSLRTLNAGSAIRVRWMRNGLPATVNGQVPTQGGGSAPATQPLMPSITVDLQMGSSGGDGVGCTVTNNDPSQSIWVKRRATVTTGAVSLEALMRDNTVVTTSYPIDASPFLLSAGASATTVSDLYETEDNQSVVFAAEYFQDLSQNGPFNNQHALGPALGNVMTSSLTSPEGTCAFYNPVILVQPVSSDALLGHSVDLRVNAEGNDMDLTYEWMKEGVPLTNGGLFHGVDTDELSIDEVLPETQGFYQVRVSNPCGSVTSDSALVFVTGVNVAPPRPEVCKADVGGAGGVSEHDGILDNNDFIAFINAFFEGDESADVGVQGGDEGSDGLFDNNDFIVFIDLFFSGC